MSFKGVCRYLELWTCTLTLISSRLCAKLPPVGVGGPRLASFWNKNTRTKQKRKLSSAPPLLAPPRHLTETYPHPEHFHQTPGDNHSFSFTLKHFLPQSTGRSTRASCSQPAAVLFAKLTSFFTTRWPILFSAYLQKGEELPFTIVHSDQ